MKKKVSSINFWETPNNKQHQEVKSYLVVRASSPLFRGEGGLVKNTKVLEVGALETKTSKGNFY